MYFARNHIESFNEWQSSSGIRMSSLYAHTTMFQVVFAEFKVFSRVKCKSHRKRRRAVTCLGLRAQATYLTSLQASRTRWRQALRSMRPVRSFRPVTKWACQQRQWRAKQTLSPRKNVPLSLTSYRHLKSRAWLRWYVILPFSPFPTV